MLDVKIDKGEVDAHIEGTTAELTADILTLVHSMFHQLYHEDCISAILFRMAVEKHISDAFKLSNMEVQENE